MNMKTQLSLSKIRTSVLELCYTDAQIQTLLDRTATESVVDVLLSIPQSDAIRLLAGMLAHDRQALSVWANACAVRAKEYAAAYPTRAAADAYAARAAAADTARVAADTSYAAADAAAAAAYAAAATRAAEQQIAIRHGAMLLGWGV